MKWISINDELPNDNKDCLSIMKDGTIFMSRCIDKFYWKFYFSDNGLQADQTREKEITHWMPLPKPPIYY